MMKLYDYYRSSACFRVRIALNLKQLDYTAIPIHLINNGGEQNSKDYSSLNPQKLVPTLLDGSTVLTQSLAIIEYLEETYPHPPLLPDSAAKRALVRAFSLAIVADIHPLNNLRVLQYLQRMHVDEENKNQWYLNWIQEGFTALENLLTAQQSPGKFCFGDHPTLADICLVPQMYNARRFSCDLSAYPNLVRIDANCQKLEAFQQAWPAEVTT